MSSMSRMEFLDWIKRLNEGEAFQEREISKNQSDITKHDSLISCNRAKISHLEEVLNEHAEEFEKLSKKLNILIDLHKAELLEKQAKQYEEKAKTLRTTAKNLSKND